MKNKRNDNITFDDIENFEDREELVFAYNWVHNNGFLESLSDAEIKTNMKTVLYQILARLVMYIPNFSDDLVERMIQIHQHPKKTENEEYLKLAFGGNEAKRRLKAKSDRVSGKNNPAYDHGGRLSPFSDKFIKYQDGDNRARDVFEKSMKTKSEHPERQPTKIEYYLNQGMSEEDARKALSNRQTTFSLDTCIEKYGIEKGTDVWQQRQAKWKESLSNMTDDELFYFVRGKCRGAYSGNIKAGVTDGYLYLFKLIKGKDVFLKVGFSGDYNKRIRALRNTGNKVIELCKIYGQLETMFEFENAILEAQKERLVYRNSKLKEKVDHPFETMVWNKELESELLETFSEALKINRESCNETT